jgi:hypothetical protein
MAGLQESLLELWYSERLYDDVRERQWQHLARSCLLASNVVPEFSGVAIRMGKPVADVILGVRQGDPVVDQALAQWCQIAKVLGIEVVVVPPRE